MIVLCRMARKCSRRFILAGLILIILSYQLILLICTYHEYILAVLPDPPLPVQRRSAEASGSNGMTDGARTRDGRQGESDRGHKEETSPKILCLIVTSPQYHEERAAHVAATWATHCTRAVFLTTAHHPLLPDTLLTSGASTYHQLWDKVTQGFVWAYKQRTEYDWVVKTDDDTFLLVENLQKAVLTLDPDQPQATGLHLRTWETSSTYLNGGAGYVLSRGAVTRLVEEGINGRVCSDHLNFGPGEDVNMADCLTYLGVELLDSRDSSGRQRFHVYPPNKVLDPRQANSFWHLWLKKISVLPYKFGFSEMSKEVISFHYVDAQTMYLLYYLIYFVNPGAASNSTFRSLRESLFHTPEPRRPALLI